MLLRLIVLTLATTLSLAQSSSVRPKPKTSARVLRQMSIEEATVRNTYAKITDASQQGKGRVQ